MAFVADIGQARDLVCKVLNDAWSALENGIPINWDDQDKRAPTDGSAYLEAGIVHGASGQAALGGKDVGLLYRSNARLVVDIRVPVGGGRDDDLFIQAIRAAFIGKRLNPDVVQFINVQITEMPRDGQYARTRVVVYFTYDEVF